MTRPRPILPLIVVGLLALSAGLWILFDIVGFVTVVEPIFDAALEFIPGVAICIIGIFLLAVGFGWGCEG